MVKYQQFKKTFIYQKYVVDERQFLSMPEQFTRHLGLSSFAVLFWQCRM